MSTTCIIPRSPQVATRIASSAVILAPLYLILAGTAGMYSSRAIVGLADFSPTPIIRVVGRKSQSYRTISESLFKVRNTFGLKMSELAQIFGVSRTAAYDWLNGTIPKAEIALKIETLASFADSVRDARGAKMSISRSPLSAGRSIVKAMKSGENLEAAISKFNESLLQEPRLVSMDRKSLAIRGQSSDSFSEIVTPIIFE